MTSRSAWKTYSSVDDVLTIAFDAFLTDQRGVTLGINPYFRVNASVVSSSPPTPTVLYGSSNASCVPNGEICQPALLLTVNYNVSGPSATSGYFLYLYIILLIMFLRIEPKFFFKNLI